MEWDNSGTVEAIFIRNSERRIFTEEFYLASDDLPPDCRDIVNELNRYFLINKSPLLPTLTAIYPNKSLPYDFQLTLEAYDERRTDLGIHWEDWVTFLHTSWNLHFKTAGYREEGQIVVRLAAAPFQTIADMSLLGYYPSSPFEVTPTVVLPNYPEDLFPYIIIPGIYMARTMFLTTP